jgi:hypothetical protein
MENNIVEVLHNFSCKLQEISPKPIKDMEIVLPYDNYRQFENEMYKLENYRVNLYELPTTKFNLQTIGGINFSVSCKELNDQLIQKKLQECFKILSK